jgi:hypothetical protein
MRVVAKERVLLTLLAFSTLVLTTAALRDPARVGLTHDGHWGQKLEWQACADCVLAGDSRIAYGLSPRSITEVLEGPRVLNFAFPFGIYTDEYLDAIERVLDPDSERPSIVLGITARALVPVHQTEDGNGYDRLRREAADRSDLARLLAVNLSFTSPIRIDRLVEQLSPVRRSEPLEVRYPDGWTAHAPTLDQQRVNSARSKQLSYYQRLYARTQVTPQIIDCVVRRTREWRERGIRVYGWRPPTDPDLREIEDRLSGFDEASFVRRFEAVGGIWIPVSPADWQTYDGSHLHRTSAVRMSRHLAGCMRDLDTIARR